MTDLVERLRIKAGMIEMGERIAWGSDSALMREAADALELAAPAVQGEPSRKELYKEFSEWCQSNPSYDLDCRLHTHGGPIDRGGYISNEKTRVAFAAYRAGRLSAPQPAEQQPSSAYACTVPDDCETLHWRGQILSMNELVSVAQPAAGEEIMVNAPGDVYTLPLQPSGLSSGPRFVVHVPAQPAEQQPCPEAVREGAPYNDPAFESLCREHEIWGTAAAAQCAVFWEAGKRVAEQQPALTKYQPCWCVLCTCEHETQCQGCGAKHCGTHPVGQIPGPVYQQPAPGVAGLVEALTELCDEIDKHDIHAAISSTSILWFKRKAREALSAHRERGGEA